MGIKDIIQPFCNGKSIIVVGNSSSLLEDRQGKAIDAFDLVVRMNHGYPRKGTISATGQRTDIWVCAFNSLASQAREYQFFNPTYAIRLNNETYIHPEMRQVLLLWDMENWQRAKERIGTPNYPSTGVVTLYFFLEYLGLEQLVITGFDFFEKENFYHTRSGTQNQAFRWHTPMFERRYVQQFKEQGRIRELSKPGLPWRKLSVS